MILVSELLTRAALAAASDSVPCGHCPMSHGISLSSAQAIVFWGMLGWIAVVVAYFWWAIRHYNLNWGLSPEEWKILHPETYCKDKTEIETYLQRRLDLEKRTGKPLVEPTANPYEKDSFGLPPGTVRGALALSILMAFLLIQAVGLISPEILQGNFEQLNSVFKMVMAFYFSARALEVLDKNRKAGTDNGKAEPEAAPASPAADVPANSNSPAAQAPAEADPVPDGGVSMPDPTAKSK